MDVMELIVQCSNCLKELTKLLVELIDTVALTLYSMLKSAALLDNV